MGEFKNKHNASVTTSKNKLAMIGRKISFLFSPPELVPIITKGEKCTVKVAMTKREIKKITKDICESAISKAKK